MPWGRGAGSIFVAVVAAAHVLALPTAAAPPGPGPFAYHVTLSPATSTVAAGASATLMVTVDKPTLDTLPIAVTTTGPTGVLGCPNQVRIPEGLTRTTFRVKGLQPGGPVSVTVTLPVTAGGAAASSQVTVQGLSISLSPATLKIPRGTVGKLTATLDAPAPIGGVAVAVTQTGPANLIALPASVTIPAGNSTALINVKALHAGGPATVTASLPAGLGGASDSSSVTVVLFGKLPAQRP